MASSQKPFKEHDSYWRTDMAKVAAERSQKTTEQLREQLNQQCHENHTQTRRDSILHLLQRADRGLLCYAQSTTEELNMFIRQRGLSGAVAKRRPDLYTIFDRADNMPTFHRFMESPAELRSIVYAYYLAPFAEKALHAPTMPPLARFSQQLRE